MNPRLVLIDTSAWLLILGRTAHPLVARRVAELVRGTRAATTPAVTLELLGGARTEQEFGRLRDRLRSLHQIPLGEAEWSEAALIGYRLRRAGKTMPHIDILIGAAAIRSGALLLHADRHYAMMAEETPLAQENVLSL